MHNEVGTCAEILPKNRTKNNFVQSKAFAAAKLSTNYLCFARDTNQNDQGLWRSKSRKVCHNSSNANTQIVQTKKTLILYAAHFLRLVTVYH